jgi:hypothetical protein
MKQARLVLASLAIALAGTWAVWAFACDNHKNSASAVTAQATATKTKARTADATSCGAKSKASAVTASAEGAYDHCAAKRAKTTAVTASTEGAYDHCAAKGAKTTAVTASTEGAYDHCAAKGARAKTTAFTASTEGAYDHCAAKGAKAKTTAFTASAGSADHCAGKATKNRATAVTASAGSGGYCSGNGLAKAAGKSAHASHADCEACADMSLCNDELNVAGAHTQVVPLKNGVMFVYTADTPSQVSAVQSAMSRRSERMLQLVNAGDRARLCAECKTMRGAMASGKLSREVVNIEGGSLTLMTSEDPKTVAKIHAMVEGRSLTVAKKS